MGASEYKLGREDEYHVRKLAEGLGFLVVRAAGSHGTDLIVFTPEGTYALDVKRNDWAAPLTRKVLASWLDCNVWPVLVCVVIHKARRRVLWRPVESDGSMGDVTDQPPWEWDT